MSVRTIQLLVILIILFSAFLTFMMVMQRQKKDALVRINNEINKLLRQSSSRIGTQTYQVAQKNLITLLLERRKLINRP